MEPARQRISLGVRLIRMALGGQDGMSRQTTFPGGNEDLAGLIESAWLDFDYAADYVWKVPRFLKGERRREREALRDFPRGSASWRFRRHHEFLKLRSVFPYLIAQGSLFSILSLLENYILRLAVLAEQGLKRPLAKTKGQGLGRGLAYLRGLGCRPEGLPLWPQIDAALKIRHSLMHTGGVLVHCRDEQELRRLERSGCYLAPTHRGKVRTRDDLLVWITESPLGERLQVSNTYAFLVSAYCRDYFMSLCEEVRPRLEHCVV
jgi:hypothetical protein